LLLFSGLAFFLMLPWMQRTLTITLDVDWLWRRALPVLWRLGQRLADAVRAGYHAAIVPRVTNLTRRLTAHLGPNGILGRSWQIGTTAMWVALLLISYVAIYAL